MPNYQSYNILLSIIIPTYNSQELIANSLRSINNQTFTDYEVIVIDGLSTDDTKQIVYDSIQINNKICWLSEKDSGIYDAMNKGIKLAKGEWLYFLGSDDKLYNENVLEKIFTPDIKNYDVVYGSVYNNSLNRVYDGEFNFEKICLDGICHQSIFYRKELFLKYGMYDTEMKVYAHIYLDKILFANPDVKWKYINVIVANYHGAGFSRTNFDTKYWRNAEDLLNRCFKNIVSKKVIYSSLLPIPRWQFDTNSFLMACKIAVKGGNFKGLYYWFIHPYQIIRLTIKKLL